MDGGTLPNAEAAGTPVASWSGPLLDWEAELTALKTRFGDLFGRCELRRSAAHYLDGLLNGAGRKNGWRLAELAGDTRPHRIQAVLGRGRWDAEAARDLVRAYVSGTLGDRGAVLVADEAAFPKRGEGSVGVARQHMAAAGRVENCQLGIFLAYTSRLGQALVDRRLFLPEAWTGDPERRAKAGIPPDLCFADRPAIVRDMLLRALDAGLPCAFVMVEAPYGTAPELRAALEGRRQAYLLALPREVPLDLLHGQSAAAVAATLTPDTWRSLPVRDATAGARLHDWARIPLPNGPLVPGWNRWLLVRHGRRDQADRSAYLAFAADGTPLAELAGVAGLHRSCAECIVVARSEFGLDHYEARSWGGWHRHETLCMAALAFLARLRSLLRPVAGA